MVEALKTREEIVEFLWQAEVVARQEYVDYYMKPELNEEQRAILRQKALDAKHILRSVIGKEAYASEVVLRSKAHAAELRNQGLETSFGK